MSGIFKDKKAFSEIWEGESGFFSSAVYFIKLHITLVVIYKL
jgi:hypothetical protein